LLLFSLISCNPSWAVDATESLTELHRTLWTTKEGAPGQINRIVQTADGYLWLGAVTGLFRFDGTRFEHFVRPDTGLPINGDISSLFVSSSGDLWVGLRFGGAYQIHQHEIKEFGEKEGLPRHSLLDMAATPDGTLWAAVTNGVYWFDGRRWLPAATNYGYAATDAGRLLVDQRGSLWARSQQGTSVLRRGAGRFEMTQLPGGRGWLFLDSDGRAWAVLGEEGFLPLTSGGRKVPIDASFTAMGASFEDREGSLWSAARRDGQWSVIRVSDAGKVFRDQSILSPGEIHSLARKESRIGSIFNWLEDREGNVWAVMDNGLVQFRSNKLHAATESLSEFHQAAMTVNANGDVWIAQQPMLLKSSPGQTRPSLDSRLGNNVVAYMLGEHDGSLTIGMDDSVLIRYADGERRGIALWPGAVSYGIQGMMRDPSGALWVSNVADGLYRQDHQEWVKNGGFKDLPLKVPVVMLTDDSQRLWFGYDDDEVAMVESNRVRKFGIAQGLEVGVVLAMCGHENGIWVGGSENVAIYLRDRFLTLRGTDGRGFAGVSGIVQDANGALWLNGKEGIVYVANTEVEAFRRDASHGVYSSTFNYEDGLDGVAEQLRPLNTAVRAGDGKVWFTTSAGVYWIDPKHIQRNTLPPPVMITSVVAQGQTFAARGELNFPPRTTNLQVDYTALSLSVPSRVRFKYKLTGVDTTWQEPGNRRQAFYTNMTPGNYQFHVIAANEDGVWNEEGATALFNIAPAFYQTRWFHTFCGLSILVVLWQLYRLRLRQLTKQVQGQLSIRLEERERIARDLHDTLLQSTQGLILLFQGFAGRIHGPDPMRKEMESALDQADGLLDEARDRVVDLRTTALESDVARAIGRAGKELFAGSSTLFHVDVTGTPRPLSAAVADDVYRIAREGLTNAARHAQATVVEVEIAYGIKDFRLRVRDNGKGLEPSIQEAGRRAGHFGLLGMRERARKIGGNFNLWTADRAGIEIELVLPATAAYQEERTSFLHSLTRRLTFRRRR
jgi:signal transduction histidine kinase/ligand-binding sensor domain-containing protein